MKAKKQITVSEATTKITCDCGFYEKAFSPRQLARTHNRTEHGGNYRIWDVDNQVEVDQLTGADK